MMKNYQAHKELITYSIAILLSDMSEVPTKCIAVTVTLDVNASIQYIDFEGRTDGESMRKILAQIKPRQLVSQVQLQCSLLYNSPCYNTDSDIRFHIVAPKYFTT